MAVQEIEVPSVQQSGVACRRILVVDHQEVVLAGMRALLAVQEWVSRCLGATSGGLALEMAFKYEPHVALIDLLVGDEAGSDLCRAILTQSPTTRVLLMSAAGRISERTARAAGAHGFISKCWSGREIVAGVRRATLGRSVFVGTPQQPARTALSVRERDVLRQLASGATNPEAATALHLSPHTIKQHTSSVYRKLGVRNRTEAVSRAQGLGLIAV